jgi:hypothetical protein
MYMHLAAYSESIAQLTNTDINAAADDVLTRRNSHLIFTEQYNLLAAWAFGTSLARARFGNAALTQLGNNHIWPIDVTATVPDDPAIMDLRDAPLVLPQNEELTLEVTNTAAGPAEHGAILWLGLPEWNMNYPPFIDRLRTRATAVVVAGTETTWTALAELTFERDLLNGVYAVVGANVVAANALAFRLRFPDQPNARGKQHRPGGLVQDTAALAPWPAQFGGFGEWGRFHTFTPPEVQVFADAAGGTYEVRLDLLYLGRDEALLRRF